MYIDLRIKYPLFWSDFKKYEFPRHLFKKIKLQISWKSVQWEQICSIWTNRQTDMTKLTVAFRNCANAPNNCLKIKRAVSKYYTIWTSYLILISSNLMKRKTVCLIYLLFIYWPCYWKRLCTVCVQSVTCPHFVYTCSTHQTYAPTQTELLQMFTALCA